MTDKNDKLQKTLTELTKRFGDLAPKSGSSMIADVDVISTGSLGLDRATGVGGFPRGRMSHIWGDYSTGKSTLCLQAVANAQAQGFTAAYIDMEGGVDRTYATALGVDMDALYISQPVTGEQALEFADALMRSGEVAIVIVDSVAALTPMTQIEGQFTDKNFGAIALMLSKSLSKLKGAASKSNTALVFVNQERYDQGAYVAPGSNYKPVKPFGGKAIRFYPDLEIFVRRRFEKEKRQDQQIVVAECKKNRLAPPFMKAEFVIEYGKGVDNIEELATLAIEGDVLTVKGGGNYYLGEKHWRGKPALVDALRADDSLANEIRKRVME